MMPPAIFSSGSASAGTSGLVYLAVHNHAAATRWDFRLSTWKTHIRGFPALLDIRPGSSGGSLVFAEEAVAR